jgi:hypothetical protein
VVVAARRRLSAEEGFSMLLAIGVLAVTALLTAAVWTAVNGDVRLSQHDLDSKRAYYAATAGVNAFLYQLNQNPDYWETCSNDAQSQTAVAGSSTESYSWSPIPATGYASCTSDPISSMIDTSTGTLRLKFIGYSGNPAVSRGVVAGFREDSPFDFLWYTVYEALDSSLNGYSGCAVFYRNTRASTCNINWISGDVINGPMYTEDQYLVPSGNAPTFGRNSGDDIESAASGTNSSAICANDSCGGANIKGTPVWNAPTISPPSNNSFLDTDAALHGKVYSGTTTVTLNGTTATVVNCPSSCTTASVDLTKYPILYISNASGCTPASYNPFSVTYTTSGCSGDAYVSGSYTTPVTIAAADDIIVNGNLTTTHDSSGAPSGAATLGMVANEFIRVMHGCSSSSGNVSSQTFSNLSIDAAIFAIQHSFIVDNFNCGAALSSLTVNGAIAQNFRGAVGTTASNGTRTGYLKNYNYDDRLEYLLPPYLFDISSAGWHLARQTLCVPGGSDSSTAC